MSERNLLTSTFPEVLPHNAFSADSSTFSVGRHYPVTVKEWDIESECIGFNYGEAFPHADWSGPGFSHVKDFDLTSANETDTQYLVYRQLFEAYNCIRDEKVFRAPVAISVDTPLHPIRKRTTPFRVYCDAVAMDKSGAYLVVEVKPVGGGVESELLLANSRPIETIWTEFKNGIDDDFVQGARAIAQCLGYMRDCRSKYGVITTYNYTWLLFEAEADVLLISKAVKCTSTAPTIMQALFFTEAAARCDSTSPYTSIEVPDRRRTNNIRTQHEFPDVDYSQHSQLSVYSPPAGSSSQPTEPLWMVLRSATRRSDSALPAQVAVASSSTCMRTGSAGKAIYKYLSV